MTPSILAIDLGTSGAKAALVSLSGEVLSWEFEAVKTHLFPDGGAEQDPQEWWSALVASVSRLLSHQDIDKQGILAICCSTQGESTVPVDKNGKPLMNAILWMDTRGASRIRRHVRGIINISGYAASKLYRWIRLTGGAPSLTGKDPATHMLYIRDLHPDIYERTHKFLNVLDYLNFRLTGRFAATHDSILTSWVTDNRDPANVRYDATLIAMSGIAREKLPDIVPCTEVLGTLSPAAAGALGLPANVKVVAGSIDNTAAAIGSGAVNNGQAHLYLGTSSWLAAHVPFKKTDIFNSMASVPCAQPDKYLLIALQATAGGNLIFLRDNLFHDMRRRGDFYAQLDAEAATAPPGSNGVLYTPWIYGERSPVDDPTIRAGLHNLSLETTRAGIFRAVLEGIALNTRWVLAPFEKNLGQPTGPIHLAGGGANSGLWCQILADVLDRPIRQMANPIQANVLGAAFIGMAGIGELAFGDIQGRVAVKQEYQPRGDTRDLYDTCYQEFQALYKQNKAIYRRLNRV